MKSAIYLILSLVAFTACAEEADILETIKQHPARSFDGNFKPHQYGDSVLVQGVPALADIPKPWTVPKIIAQFEKETMQYRVKLVQRIVEKNNQMWAGADQEEARCGYLASLLAASRDPRAAIALGKTLDLPDFPGGYFVSTKLYLYFFNDPRFKIVPPDGHEMKSSTRPFPREHARLKEWWKLNKDALEAAVQAP